MYAKMACLGFVVIYLTLISVNVISGQLASDEERISYTIVEELAPHTFVGNIYRDAKMEQKYTDSEREDMKFRFLNPPNLDFNLEESTGIIRTGDRIDRDQVCANQLECIVIVDVAALVTEPTMKLYELIKVAIHVLDLNDNWPFFTEQHLSYEVLESAEAGGNSFIIPTAVDPDSGPFGVQRYQLLSDSGKFELKVKRKLNGATDVRLVLADKVDRETQSFYNFKVVAFDGGDPSKSGSVDISVYVKDDNDNEPIFDDENYEVTVPENAPIETTILQVHASDLDSGLFGEVLYSFVPQTQSIYGHIFGIVNTTGEIYISGVIDFEQGAVHQLYVVANDRGPVSAGAETTVVIHVIDVNDHSPMIAVNTLGMVENDVVEISENSESGTFVAHITVTDPDRGRNAEFNCSLNDNQFRLERLHKGEYKIITNGRLDREARAKYSLAITCKDGGVEPQVSIKHIQVIIADINDNPPIFSQQLYTANVTENNFIGVFVLMVNATDFDTGENAALVYSLYRDARDQFHINPVTGKVTAQAVFDREQTKQVRFTVVATDKGNSMLSGSATVIVSVNDINDERPRFNQPSYSFSVFENEHNTTEVGVVTAVDADSEPYNQFVYSIMPSYRAITHFAIDPQAGKIYTTTSLDREAESIYYLEVVATDMGLPPMSSTTTVTIYVADKNDNAPVFDYPTQTNNTIYISNKAPAGHIITKITAHDLDIDRNGNLTYHISRGNSHGIFHMDPRSGRLKVNKDFGDIDYQTYELEILVRDHGLPVKTAVANMNIVVNKSIIYPFNTESGILQGHNFTIVVTLACIFGVIMVVLVIAIVILRRQDREKKNHKYNCRMEALKMLHAQDMSKDTDMSHLSNNTSNMSNNNKNLPNNSCLSSNASDKPKKEVSFSLDMEAAGNMEQSQDKTVKSWSSSIDQNPQACSSILTHKSHPESSPEYRSGHPGAPLDHHHHHHALPHDHPSHAPHLQRPWSLTQRELEVHQLLQMLKQDQDADSAYSGEGSNTDSGRGNSEEGESHRHHTDAAPGGPPQHSAPLNMSTSSNQVVPSLAGQSLNMSSHSYSSPPSQQLHTFTPHTDYGDRYRPYNNAGYHSHPKDGSYLEHIYPRKSNTLNTGFVHDTPTIQEYSLQTPQNPCNRGYYGNHTGRRGYNTDDSETVTEASDEECEVQYSVTDMRDILHAKSLQDLDNTDIADDATTTSGSYVVDPQDLCNEIDELFFKDMIV